MPRITINASILCHIELDSELSGRFGVQGNTFKNTVGYLNQYLQTLKSLPPQLAKLAASMEALVIREDAVRALNSSSENSASLTTFCMNVANEIMRLNSECDVLLPGGWSGIGRPGHAMIYQFQRKTDGGLLFSIYNSGSGIEEHEKLSSTANERFFPVKIYNIPEPVDSNELSILLSRLVLPQLSSHPGRKNQTFNAKKLYENIEQSMVFLNAISIHADTLVPEHATTAGQLSGTCAQRSIHQMLKINFDKFPNYQRFIFDFKLYALKDFIATHKPPRHKEITQLIHGAIKNNFNILQQPGVFSNTNEQDDAIKELDRLQQNLSVKGATQPVLPQIKSPSARYVWYVNAKPMETFKDDAQPLQTASAIHLPMLISGGPSLSKQLSELIKRCEVLKVCDPMWVIENIEQAMIKLPLPTRPIQCGRDFTLSNLYDDIPFYNGITQLDDIGTNIESLQQLYAQAFNHLSGDTQLPNRLVTQFSLLALRDYFDVQQAKQQKKPAFHFYIHYMLFHFLKGFRHCAFVATNHPELDQRLKQLMRIYDDLGIIYFDDQAYFKFYYSALFDTEPNLKADLQGLYNQAHETDHSSLHVALRKNNLSAIWYFFEQLDPEGQLKKDSIRVLDHRFDVLIKKIQHQIQLEKNVVCGFNPFLEGTLTPKTQLKIEMDSDKENPRLKMNTASLSVFLVYKKFTKPNAPNDMTQHKYKLSDSRALDALLMDYPVKYLIFDQVKRKTENNIQLSSHGKQLNGIINKEDFYTRELLHLRRSRSNQIDFTLDYFKAGLSKLSDPDIQRYMEANIFDLGLLCNSLDMDAGEKNPVLLSRFDEFIHKGLQQFSNQDGLLSHDSIFFIRLGVYIDGYAARYKPALSQGRLEKKQHYLNALISIHTDPAILSSLHTLHFLTAVTRHQVDEGRKDDDQDFADTLSSYFYFQAKGNLHIQDDTASRFERQRAEYHFKLWMQQIPKHQIKALIKPIVERLGIEVTNLTLTGTYPEFTLSNKAAADTSEPRLLKSGTHGTTPLLNSRSSDVYTVNAESGKVFKANKAFSAVPLNIQNHPIMRRLGLEHESSCFISPDGKIIEFITPDTSVRVIQHENNGLTVQKKWTLGGREDWYELQPLTKKQEQAFGLGVMHVNYSANQLPAQFTDASMTAWTNSSGHSFIARNNQPLYQETERGQFDQLNDHGVATGNIITNRPHDFEQFEDPAFFSVNLDKQTRTNGTVYFARYGLTLMIDGNKVTLPDTNYTLIASPYRPAGLPQVASLYFTDGTHQQCIIPVQPFYVAPSKSEEKGDYYRLIHDTSGHVPAEKLKKHWKNTSLAEKEQPLWSYEHSATTITYKLVNGAPRPDTAADSLYLCYLYLGTHDTDKAWAVLDDLNQRLSLEGTPQELMYLSWIINAMPVMLRDEDADAKLETPRYVACQLKALAIYTDFLAQDKKPALPDKTGFDLTKANGCYQALCADEIIAFYQGLSASIYALYSQLQRMERHLSKKYKLPDVARKSLLNHYEHSLPDDKSNALGSLGYEKRRLSLKTLLAEYNRLDAIETSSPATFPPQFAKRKARINAQLAKQLPVMKKSTVIERISIDLSLPADIKMNESLLPNHTQQVFSKWQYNVSDISSMVTSKQAMAALSSDIDQHDFIVNFPRYLDIARNKADPNRMQLSTFCEKYLKGHRHSPLDKQDSNIPYLTNVLYRLLNNPDYGKNSYHDSLNYLTLVLSECSVPPIEVYQAKDVFEDILATSHDIWEDLKQVTPAHIPMKTQELQDENLLAMPALIEKMCMEHVSEPRPSGSGNPLANARGSDTFNEFCAQYRLAETNYQSKLTDLVAILPKISKPDQLRQGNASHVIPSAARDLLDLSSVFNSEIPRYARDDVQAVTRKDEQIAGDLKYACIQEQRKAAQACLGQKNIRVVLSQQATGFSQALENKLSKQWTITRKLANQAPGDSDLARRFRIELAASKRHTLADNELLKLYLRADLSAYLERTGLSIEQCETLHVQLHECVTLGVHHQHFSRLLKALAEGDESHQLASILMSENHPDAQHDPALMLFQYEENKLLRPRQVEALTNLLSTPDDPYLFKESVEKIIMGGGKSKVILPLLAAKKAAGLNLVVIEVPRALLATNHVDLNSTSQRLFNQKAHRFEFDRDSDCSSQRLEQIYQQFVDISTNQDYLVTTGESMQSLELKYLELLLSRPDEPDDQKQWEKQVYWAGKITQLLKQTGDVIIDEVHQGLLLKKKLNYTLGSQQAISPALIQHSCELYQFVDKLAQDADVCKHATLKDSMENQWPQDIMPRLLGALIEHPDSPLQSHIRQLRKRYGDGVVEDLKVYLNNDEHSEPFIEILRAATPAMQEAMAFYKEQLTLLPQTLGRHHKEHYGPSRQLENSALKRTLAIPYSANEKPNERSRFGNPMETVNYSIQSMLMDGLSEELLLDVIKEWQIVARYELQNDVSQYQQLDQTPTAKGVAHLLAGTGFTLQTINLRNQLHVNQLLKHFKHNKALLFHVLETQVLRQITTEPAILHSDAYNHLDIYHSGQGLSGTPWNQSTYHQRLQYNHKTSLGTDGYIQRVLKGKATTVRGAKFTTCVDYFSTIFDGKKDIRAIIDIGATFAGLGNLDVAKELGRFSSTHLTHIKYILYFNDEDVLCAWDVRHPTRPSIELGTSDPAEINQKLNCKPDDRLTYYDQSHTIGADLNLAPNSRGIVLVNEKTHLQSFLQGCMRMRGLDEQQTVDIIVPEALQKKSLDDLIDTMATNELNQLAEDNFVAAMAKMDNIVRQDLLQRLANLDDDDIATRYQWAQAFKRYFVEIKNESLFEQYGGISREMDTDLLLKQHSQWLMEDWKKCLASIETEPRLLKSGTDGTTPLLNSRGSDVSAETMTEVDLLQIAMQGVVDLSIPLCKPKTTSRAKKGCADLEVEVQKEQEILKEQEKLEEEERYNPKLKDVRYDPSIAKRLCQGTFTDTKTLTDLCAPMVFSPNLLASPNYSTVYEGQKHMLGFYLKPVHAILFRVHNNQLTACIISNDEAETIKKLLLNEHHNDMWLSTTQHTRLAGHRPDDMMSNPEYQTLMEQVHFFNGECNTLFEQTTPFLWLKEGAQAKLAFFEKHILPYRETSPSDVHRLRSALSNKIAGFDYINNHAFEDLSDVDWLDVFPDALPADIAAFKALSAAFSAANKAFDFRPLVLDEYLKQALLPPSAISYLKNHLELLKQYTHLLTCIKQSGLENRALNTLNDSQRGVLQSVLHLDFHALLSQQVDDKALLFQDFHGLIKAHICQPEIGKTTFFLPNRSNANTAGINPDLREIQAAIDQLRIRALELIIDSLKTTDEGKSKKYCDEADAALALYNVLSNLTRSYKGDKKAFATSITEAVKQYEPVLKQDYRLKQILYDILNALLIVVSLAKYAVTGEFNFRLFDARSKTTAIVEDIEHKNQPKKPGV